jgi:hypothetical protein
MRALLLLAGFWAGLSVAQAADEDPASLFRKVCMGPGPFRQSLSDFVEANGWKVMEGELLTGGPDGRTHSVPRSIAFPPQPWAAGKFPVLVSVSTAGEFDYCQVSDHALAMDRHLDRVRSTLGLVGPGEDWSHIMRFPGSDGSDEKALQWSLSSESSDHVIFGESENIFPTTYLQRRRSSMEGKP